MAVTKSLVFITCLCFARDFVFCDDYEETGKEITLTPSIRGNPTEIVWKHNGNMVLWYDGSEVVEYGSFTRRLVIDFETGQLTIRKLTSQDSGQYTSKIVINGKDQTSSHTVTVLDVLPEPQVTCEPDETSNVKKLLCSVESRTQLRYKWRGPNIKVQSGPELLVEEQEENRDSVYTCTVENQANSKSTDFTLRDCHTGGAGTAVLVSVIIVTILLIILLILLGIFLYRRRKKLRQPGKKPPDPEHGSLLRNDPTDVIPGSSEATLPSHTRLPPQKPSIVDKKWHQDNGAESSGETDEEQKLLEKKSQEQNLKQSPQSAVSETNQEDTGSGNEGDLDKNEKNSKNAVEAEENIYSKPDETEKERHKQREEEEEKERSQKQESGNEEKFPEHQNEREEQKPEDNREDNQTPGEKEEPKDRRDTGEGQNLLRNDLPPPVVMTGSSEATLPSHTRLPPQKPSIVDKKWDQDNGAESSGETDEGQTLLGKKSQEQNLKQSPQSAVSETNQEDSGSGNEGELDKDEKNSENAVEAEENTYSKPDETEKERHKQREEEEEKEKSQKQESGDEEKFPDHQNEREEQKPEDNREDNRTPGEKEEPEDRRDTETVSPQSAVTEKMDSENEAEQQHKNEKKSQSDKGEQSVEQQNESMRNQKTKDTANSEDYMRPGEKEERSEEKNQDGIDRADTVEARDHPAVDQLLDDEALSSPAVIDSPCLEKKPINSSDSSSSQTDRSNYTEQDKEEERKRPGLEPEGGQEQTNPDPETQSCKQTDSDTIINSVPQRLGHDDELSRQDEEVQTKNLKQSPQSAVSETNQKDTGNEGDLDKNMKNSENVVEAEENTCSEPDETVKERHKQREEEEEKEKSQKQESGNEKFPDHQNEREEQKPEDNREDNQTPGEKEEEEDRRDTVIDSPCLEKKPINSSDSSSSQTDRSNFTEQDKEERKRPGLEPEGGKQTDSDTIINSVPQRLGHDDELSRQDEEVQTKNLKQSAVSETNQKDTGNGNEGELDKNMKNSENVVEAKENTYSKPDETQERHKQREEEEEEKEKSQKQESGDEEKFPEHQNEREEQKPEEQTGQEQTAEEKNPDPEIHEEQTCANVDELSTLMMKKCQINEK